MRVVLFALLPEATMRQTTSTTRALPEQSMKIHAVRLRMPPAWGTLDCVAGLRRALRPPPEPVKALSTVASPHAGILIIVIRAPLTRKDTTHRHCSVLGFLGSQLPASRDALQKYAGGPTSG
jgi:hypothetical protein